MSDQAVEKDVAAVLQAWCDGYRTMDVDATIGVLAADDDTVLVGTGIDEVRFGPADARAQLARDFEQADSVEVTIEDLRVSSRGDVAWTYSGASVRGSAGGQTFEMPGLRLTSVLTREAGGWKIRSAHLSAPYGAQDEGESFPTS